MRNLKNENYENKLINQKQINGERKVDKWKKNERNIVIR